MIKHTLHLKKILPFLFIICLMVGAYTFIYLNFHTTESLRQFHLTLKDFNTAHPITTPLLFIAFYMIYALLMLPGIILLSLLAGFLFPQPFSTLYAVTGATLGASLLYFVARTAFREILTQYSSSLIDKLENGFRNNAINYMLFLRLTPVIPFRMGNLAGAFFDVPYFSFVWTTFMGMIPSIVMYTETGKGLSVYLNHPENLKPWSLLGPHLTVVLTILALLSLVPIIIKKFRKE